MNGGAQSFSPGAGMKRNFSEAGMGGQGMGQKRPRGGAGGAGA